MACVTRPADCTHNQLDRPQLADHAHNQLDRPADHAMLDKLQHTTHTSHTTSFPSPLLPFSFLLLLLPSPSFSFLLLPSPSFSLSCSLSDCKTVCFACWGQMVTLMEEWPT